MNDTAADYLKNIRVLLKDTTHPGNIGGVARAMKTMGLSRLGLVCARTLIDGTSRAMAAGATEILEAAQFYDSLAEASAEVTHLFAFTARRRQHAPPALLPDAAANKVVDICAGGGEVALLFGGERSGLDNEDIVAANWTVEIPAHPGFSSLNLSHSVQIAAYEIRRAVVSATPPQKNYDYPTREEFDAMMIHWRDALKAVGLPKKEENRLLLSRLQLLLNRAHPNTSEVRLLRGICKAILKNHPQ